MKRMILFLMLFLAVTAVSFGKKVAAEGKTYSALGDYKVQTTDNPIQMKGEDCKAYIISYENSPMEVTVIVCKEKNCRKYVVLSDKLSVQYVCNPHYFGVERLDKSLEKEGYRTEDEGLNRVEYFHQKVLGPGQMPELEATRTIAAFFPFLLNTDESMIAEKK
ncbi:MAG TPA: hypothetical protein PK521_13425 [Bacteroidales bacterium]|nr:hypothetical protein [Bacteroidales bacterium]HOX73674.1 hypothetical protein [Bacteroidales bacterium]HQM70303.1 hypothetical protein [Bacteroidales bacterium]